MDSETVTERYERLAAAFYAETGMMAPGKDDALGHHPYEMRLARWQEWLTARDPQPRPAAPHAAPREGEPETIYGMLDRYTAAVRDAALAEFNVGPEDTGGDPDIDRAYETVHRLRVAVAAYIASQQAALDAAGEDTKRLDWIAEHSVSVSNGYTADGSPTFPGTHARVMLCDTVLPVVPRESPHWLRAAIDAARASHPEAE